MGWVAAAAVCAAVLVGPLGPGWIATGGAQGPSIERVHPRPRLLFAPGEYARFLSETSGVRRAAFDRLLEEIDAVGTRNWNERDLQLESQALAARVLLDRRDRRGATYLDLARATLRGILERQQFQRYSDSHGLVTEGSRNVEAVALAFDWLHPYWTAAERASIAGWLRTEMNEWVDTGRLRRASASPFRNDLARGSSAMVLAALTLFDEQGFEATARKALGHVMPYYNSILAAHQYAGAGGGMTEGTFYGNFTAWGQVLATEALFTAAGVRDAFSRSPFFEARLRYATHGAWPGYLTNQFGFNVHQLAPVFGDARRGPTGSALYHRAVVLLLGKRLAGSAAAREAYWAVNRNETGRTYTREWALFDLLYWSPGVARQQPAALTYREPTLGQIFSRSDWTDEATWVSFNAGPHLDTHQHYDAGNLTIFRGVDLLVDSGTFDAFGTSHWYNYYARTVAHNTITVTDPDERWAVIWGGVPVERTANDGGQRTAAPLTPAPTLDEYLSNRSAYDHGRIERFEDGPWGFYARANLTNAYQNPEYQSTKPDGARNRPKVTHVGREVVYLRRAEGRRDAVVVFDRVVATDPSFRKAVLWHSREPFETSDRGDRVDEGEIRYSGASRYDFQTLVPFTEGKRERQGRLFVSVLGIDSIDVRAIGRRIPTSSADHSTFGVEHKHRHVKDYFVEDPRNLVNDNRSTGALGRPEWPPINPPEQQWLWNDDLVGGWGQTRLEVQPAAPRAADRFLTVLVPAGGNEASPPQISRAGSPDGPAAAAVVRDGPRMDVVMFGTDASGAELSAGAVDVPAAPLTGELIVTTLTPGAQYYIRAKVGGGVQRIAVSPAPGGLTASAAGMIRVRLDAIPRARLGEPLPDGAAFAAVGGGADEMVAGGIAAGDVADATVAGSDAAPSTDAAGRSAARASARDRHPGLVLVNPADANARAVWSHRIDRMVAAGELLVRETLDDPQVAGRLREHLSQMHQGVPVFGAGVTRVREGSRVTAVSGTLYTRIDVEPVPQLSPDEAAAQLRAARGLAPASEPDLELVVLPTDDGDYHLAYRTRVLSRVDAVMHFVDANTGEPLLSFSDLKRPVR